MFCDCDCAIIIITTTTTATARTYLSATMIRVDSDMIAYCWVRDKPTHMASFQYWKHAWCRWKTENITRNLWKSTSLSICFRIMIPSNSWIIYPPPMILLYQSASYWFMNHFPPPMILLYQSASYWFMNHLPPPMILLYQFASYWFMKHFPPPMIHLYHAIRFLLIHESFSASYDSFISCNPLPTDLWSISLPNSWIIPALNSWISSYNFHI